ncbi:hypothetical protein QAD02_021780 [Eretmocerus hayati]|uniref:Uncharacterized protein n=1 Tax=Eretmocerus hayati TaxID=131215 RepID=A0ACC2PRE7_9HYME|nr:hypothetical protein QAD02_021780 [Eretmocerus hayati]
MKIHFCRLRSTFYKQYFAFFWVVIQDNSTMSSKAAKSRELDKIRVRKHREKARSKAQSEVYPNLKPITGIVSIESSSLINDDPEEPVESDLIIHCASLDDGNSRKFSSLDYDTSDIDSSSSDGDDNSEDHSNLPEENSFSERSFLENLRKWGSTNVASAEVDGLLKILKPYHPEIPSCSETLLKTDLQLKKLIEKCNPSDPFDNAEMVYFGIALHLL